MDTLQFTLVAEQLEPRKRLSAEKLYRAVFIPQVAEPMEKSVGPAEGYTDMHTGNVSL